MNTDGYMLGHSRQELERLDQQGAFLRVSTRALLQSAGIGHGMRVLDYGSGAGDVAFLARELVGEAGEVIGLDRSGEATELARARAAAKQLANVRFVEGDERGLEALAEDRPFDAVVGRLVLVHQRDPVVTLRHLTRFVRPGGVVAFHEVDYDGGYWKSDANPLLDQFWRWVRGLIDRGIFPGSLGMRLHEALEQAGLEARVVTREGRLVKNDDRGANAWVVGFARTILPLVQKLGLAREDDQPLDALVESLRGLHGYNVPVYMVGAHGVVPR
jgi:SAM-dependent methyltransferase